MSGRKILKKVSILWLVYPSQQGTGGEMAVLSFFSRQAGKYLLKI
jgi:hypothetical protein